MGKDVSNQQKHDFDRGWFRLFLDRHDLKFRTNHGEAVSVNMEAIKEKNEEH